MRVPSASTFALGVAMPQLLKYHHLEGWTGGVQGIVILKPEAPAFLASAGWAPDGAHRELDLDGSGETLVKQVRLHTALA